MSRGRTKTLPRVFIHDDRIHFQSPYSEGALALMRSIFGRRWDNFTKTNTFPLNAESAELLLRVVSDFHPDSQVDPQVRALAKQSNGNGKLVQVTEVEGGIEIKTPYSMDFVEALKNNFHPSLRAWRKENKTWFIDKYAVDRALKLLDEFWPGDANLNGDELQERKDVVDEASKYAVATTVPDDQIIELKAGKLYGFQCAGVYFLELRGSGLIADEMGLGKTVQALAYLARNEDRYPALIVCPASVKMNWAREIMRWIGSDEVSCDVFDGGYSYEIKPNGKRGKVVDRVECLKPDSFADIVIVNYDMLKKYRTKLAQMNFTTVVFDESHYLKNSTTNINNILNEDGTPKLDKNGKPYKYKGSGRAEAAAQIARRVTYRVLLTGTPVMNRPAEAWHQLHLVAPEDWPNFWRFAKQYANLTKGRWGWDYSGASNLGELHNLIIGTYMVRRRKMEVLKDMPEKAVYNTILDVDESDRKEYDKAHKDFLAWAVQTGGIEKLERVRRAESLTRMTTLKRLAAEAKVPTVIEHITDFLESREDDQLVVFAHHSSVLEALIKGVKETGTRCVSILGGDSIAKRQQAVDDFRDGKARVIVCSILAAGTGVDGLQVAQNMFFVERTWRPADHQQAEDRIHRIGQEDMCFIEYLDLDNSIDEAMANMIESKKKIAMRIVDGKEVQDHFVDEVMEEVLKLDT